MADNYTLSVWNKIVPAVAISSDGCCVRTMELELNYSFEHESVDFRIDKELCQFIFKPILNTVGAEILSTLSRPLKQKSQESV